MSSVFAELSWLTFKNTELVVDERMFWDISLVLKLCGLVTPETSKYALMPIICKYISIFHEIHEDDIELILLTRDMVNLLSRKV